jgi:hypothetical protein
MESLIIRPGQSTPSINFDLHTGRFELSGTSRPEDVISFYKPVIAWLEELESEVLAKTGTGAEIKNIQLDFRLDYFNSASSKFILKILRIIRSFTEAEKNISASWYYEEQMKEDGEYLAEAADMEFDFQEGDL